MANKRKAVVIQNEILRLKELGHSKSTVARILNINREMAGGKFASLILPNPKIVETEILGEGTAAHHGIIINPTATVGNHYIVKSLALIEDGVSVGDFCHLSTRSTLNGDCRVGGKVFIGSGSIGVGVGENVVVGARGVQKLSNLFI